MVLVMMVVCVGSGHGGGEIVVVALVMMVMFCVGLWWYVVVETGNLICPLLPYAPFSVSQPWRLRRVVSHEGLWQ